MLLFLLVVPWVASALSGEPRALGTTPDLPSKQVWVCSNKWCRERGGALPLGAALGLGAGGDVNVVPHKCFGRCGEGPNIAATTGDGTILEFHGVDSVEKVCRILSGHLGVEVDQVAAKCLELNFMATAAHKRGDLELATRLYADALDTGHAEQRGVILAGRAGAFLQLAKAEQNAALAEVVAKTSKRFLEPCGRVKRVLLAAASSPNLGATPAANVVLSFIADALASEATRASIDHDFFMSAVDKRRALRDAADAARTLPSYAKTWTRFADALRSLGKPDDANYFNDVATALDARR